VTEKSSSPDLPNCLKLILFAILSKVGNEKDAFFRLDIYVRPHTADSKIHLDRNLNCWSLSKLGPPVYRDHNGLKIIPNLDPEISLEPKGKLAKETNYHYSWPFVDPNSGDSIASYSKLQ